MTEFKFNFFASLPSSSCYSGFRAGHVSEVFCRMGDGLFTRLILTSDVSLIFLDDLFHYYSEDAGLFCSGSPRRLALLSAPPA